jgi:hypothetical protein
MADGQHTSLQRQAEEATARLARWLAEQAVAPTADGGLAVLARREHDGGALLGYPEIAGYYLVFLAAGGLPRTPAMQHAARILRWLERWMAAGGQTRPALSGARAAQEAAADWRNRQRFLFDDAMLWRGLACAERATLLDPAAGGLLRHALVERLLSLQTGAGTLRACASLGGDRAPRRWSTRRGPFLLKAVAALHDPTPPPALASALTRLQARLWPLPPLPHPQCLHAALYAREGASLLGHAPCPADLLAVLPQLAEPRHDQAAQWLRLALLAGLSPRQVELHVVVQRLLRASGDGIAFAAAPGDTRHNTWCALFAWQALTWWLAAAQGDGLEEAPRCLI